MLINLRNALMSGKRLPYDAEVEFLESTGTQYIDTGLNADSSLGYDITSSITNYDQSYDQPFGVLHRVPVIRHHFGSITSVNPNALAILLGDGTNFIVQKPEGASGEIVRWMVDTVNRTASIDNVSGSWSGVSSFDTGLSFYLFGRHDTSSDRLISARCYSAGFYVNGVLVRDYIPVRKGTVGYLYDRVTGKLFGNAGTGDFVLGPDVVPVEYIESHGTEYINAGFATTGNGLRVRLACEKTTSTTSEMAVVGRNRGSGFELYISGGKCVLWNASGKYVVNDVSIVQGTKCSIDATISSSGASLTVNGSEKTSSFTPSEPSVANVLMFRHSSQYYFVGRVYHCEMWNNDVLTRSFCPVRVGTEGAMIDTLTRLIYRNAGTGAFTYGNDLKYPIPAS